VSASYVSLLESGDRAPTLDVVVHLANSLGVPARELTGHDVPLTSSAGRADPTTLLTEALALSSTDEHDYPAAVEKLQVAWETAGAEDDTIRQFHVGVRLQYLLGAIDDREGRVALLRTLLDLPVVVGVDELQVVLATDLAAALRELGDLPGARAMAEQALERVEQTSIAGGTPHAKLLGVLVSILVEQRDLEPVEPLLERLLTIADELGGEGLQGRVYWIATLAYTRLGRGELAREYLRRAHNSLASPGMPLRDWLKFCRTSATVLLEAGGDLQEVAGWLRSAESIAERLGVPSERNLVTALLGEYELAAGNPARARDLVAAVLTDPAGLPQTDILRLRMTRELATVALGEIDTAIDGLRALAVDYEQAGMYKAAVRVWRKLDELRST
jgi:tetratricopeptide (TPR) repeat protein